MSLHILPSNPRAQSSNRTHVCSPIAKAMASRAVERATNDNEAIGLPHGFDKNDKMLRAALRHFAEHGLGAAHEARAHAEAAFLKGDQQAYQWWLGITRTLDRRLAREAALIEKRATAENR